MNPSAKLAIQYAGANVQLFSIGIQLFMWSCGLVSFLETPRLQRKGPHSILYPVVSFTILSLSLMIGVSVSYARYLTLYHADPGDPQVTKAAMDQYGGHETPQYGVSRIASTFIAFVGDGLLMYRCYFFWSDRKWIVILPALTYVASVVMGFLQMLWVEAFSGWRVEFSVAWIILNASFNVLITALISFRLLLASYRNSQLLPSYSGKVYIGIVVILVEAAMPLSVNGIALAYFMNQSRGSGEANLHEGIYKILYFFFLAISPQMIIFRVTTGRGFLRDGSTPRTPRAPGAAETMPPSTALNFARSEEDSYTRGTVGSADGNEKFKDGGVHATVHSAVDSRGTDWRRSGDGEV
ncbi:hypothetical protein FA13DRAFT_1639439 [Coprinellus micaceus]|uniref:Uncharacterized protein n=1 Tax=Coprinellus micaceus TaxID=71717 RepID=A0A4Y7SRF1_COPMI|nr:hypothetical protein FA13DRAFT_1639439 [Coprinellus micaceus]